VLATVPPAQAIILLASQLPVFYGSEDDDVDRWLLKVENTAVVHEVNNSIKLLAATSKLQKLARDWFDMDNGSFMRSWFVFKVALVRKFTSIFQG